MTKNILTINGVSKRFGDVAVLSCVTANLKQGEITAVIGPNGAGKTTLFNILSGEQKPDAGAVLFEGRNITQANSWEVAQHGIGKIFQDVRIFSNISVLENVIAALQKPVDRRLWASLKRPGLNDNEVKKKAEALLDIVGVEGSRDSAAAELSWGNKKLLGFARLMAGDFRFVLLDEPVAGVSPIVCDRIKSLIRKLVVENGVTVALIEHDMNFVEGLADTVVVLKEGKVVDHGAVNDVLTRPENIELCLGL